MERIRSFVVKSMLGPDSSEAGVFSTPLRAFSIIALTANVK